LLLYTRLVSSLRWSAFKIAAIAGSTEGIIV